MKSKRTRNVLGWGLAALIVMAAPRLAAAKPTREASWRQFHGPNRDNISTETNLLKQWPTGGPKLIWKFAQCGRGHSTVTIADGLIDNTGDFADKERLIALDMSGKVVWQVENGKSWRGPIPGARAIPTCENGVIYHMNPTGRLAAYQAKSGKEVWVVDLKEEFGAKWGQWAMSENVAIEGDVLFCAPGGAKGRIVALNKTTGQRIWTNTEIDECAAYCSPMIVTHNGVRQLITITQKSVLSVDVKTGKLLWRHRHVTKHDQNVTMPIYRDGHVFASSGHGTGGRLLKLNPRSDGVTELWLNKDIDNCHGGVLLLGKHLYGSGCRLFRKGLVCVELATGKTAWTGRKLGKVSLAYADGMLYCLSDRAILSLVKADPKACEVVSQFRIPARGIGPCLTHPVICGGRLYIRNGNELLVYDISALASK